MENSSDQNPHNDKHITRRKVIKTIIGGAIVGAGIKGSLTVKDHLQSENDSPPTNLPASPTEQSIVPPSEPTVIPSTTPDPVTNNEGEELHQSVDSEHSFQSTSELNAYIRTKELKLGWSDLLPLGEVSGETTEEKFGEKFRQERSRLRPSNHERTVGFVASDKLFADLREDGEDPIKIFSRHIEYLNHLYEEAGITLKYTLTDISILPDEVIGSCVNTVHKPKDGVEVEGGKVDYPRYQDSTWVVGSDCNDKEYPNYAEKLITRYPDRIDKGLIHELIHHSGIADLYWSQKNFGPANTAPVTQYVPDKLGFMAAGDWEHISVWEKFFIERLIENNTFSPQHDPDKISTLLNPQTGVYEHYLEKFDTQYNFIVQDRNNTNLSPRIDGFYSSNHVMDADNHNTLIGENFEHNDDTITLTNLSDKVSENKDLFVLKSNSTPGVWLPIDRHLLALLHLDQPGDARQQYIFLNPELPELQNKNAIGFDIIKREREIPTELEGNPVYGYSEINDELRGIWWVRPEE